MTRASKKLATLLSAAVVLTGLSGCESNGTTRISSVGQRGPQGAQGAQGPAGPAGPAGAAGPAGPAGPAGAAGGGLGLGSTGALAVGGLVGPGGVAGTGLLANTGDPNSRIPAVSGVLVAAGGAVRTVAGQGTIVANIVDAHAPGAIPLAGTVIGVVDATGQALIQTGNGQQYLVDGVTAATGQLVNLTVGNAQVLGSSSQTALVGASVLSPAQAQGSALTAGVGSAGQLLTLNNATTGGGGTPNSGDPVSGVVGTVTNVIGGVTGGVTGGSSTTGGATAPATGTVTNVVGGVTGILGGATGN